jgi:hypothetical protein
MDLLLITGAGASHNLGHPDDPLPLMHEWANALCSALNVVEPNLAERCRLNEGMDGEGFEKALGELLRWEQTKYLNASFAGMTDAPGQFQDLDTQATERLSAVKLVINQTLYAQFGQQRVDYARATQAYLWLLEHFKVTNLVVATTNYDRSCEAALSALGKRPETGFRPEDSESLPTLSVKGLVREHASRLDTPCLHLHGAVGWYQTDGIVYDYKAGHEFNETLGAPVVLYPDPDKDPTSDAHVAALWDEFRLALSDAERVLVLGHSLHDPALVEELRSAHPGRLGVTHLPNASGEEEERARIEALLPGAIPLPMDFGPEPRVELRDLEKFIPSER